MNETVLTCIVCPRECTLTVVKDGDAVTVTGNGCKRGVVYGEKEVTAPERHLSSTVQVTGGEHPLVPVRTSATIPKGMLADAMKEINKVRVNAPVKMGQVVIKNLLGTGADIIAARSLGKKTG